INDSRATSNRRSHDRVSSETDYLVSLGAQALAARLKRISDRMIQESRVLYRQLDASIEPSWYLVFLLLERRDAMSVVEIARALRMAHPSVAQVIALMLARGLLDSTDNHGDRRRRLLRLS